MEFYITYLNRLLFSIAVIILFYFYVKMGIINIANKLARTLKIAQRYSVEMTKGVVELPLIVIAHLIFAWSIIYLFGLTPHRIGLIQPANWLMIPLGMLLGIGMMGISALLCRAAIEIFRHMRIENGPRNVRDWLTMVRSGWLRHHLHTLNILPIPLALVVTLGQICGEEIVFRGVMMHFFFPYGGVFALVTATMLFMVMQMFLMPTPLSSIFAVIGALVIGIVDGIVYLHVPNLVPLIAAHLTFFALAVL